MLVATMRCCAPVAVMVLAGVLTGRPGREEKAN
jgi:hypothetical protein